MRNALLLQLKHSFLSLLPIFLLVLVLGLTIAPIGLVSLVSFGISAIIFILGMSLFTLGAEHSMLPMGRHIGAFLTKTKKLWKILLISFVVGTIITIAEPDLTVLASQVPSIPTRVLVYTVSIGFGLFLALALLRILLKINLNYLLMICYAIVIILSIFVPNDIFAIGFDSGGVTTGPITSPLVLALGIGATSVLAGRHSKEDSFGLIALCSVGPIIVVMILGLFYKTDVSSFTTVTQIDSFKEILPVLLDNMIHYLKEVGIAFLPIILMFSLFQIFALKLPKSQLYKVIISLIYTFVGVVLFLASVNSGFASVGNLLGQKLGASHKLLLLPLGFLLGFFAILTEPAVSVFNHQIENISSGTISNKAMTLAMASGVGIALLLSMLRIILGFHLAYILIPGYIIALSLSFFVPKIYTAVAFDSGGVATGPVTATFILPLAIGFALTLENRSINDAFGLVALVALAPLITVQLLGFITHRRIISMNEYMEKYQIDDIIYDM